MTCSCAGAVDAFDPGELDVAGRRRAADPGQRAGRVEPGDRVGDVGDDLVLATMQTWRSGTRVIARRPWPAPWSSTMVPVSAMPSGLGDDRVDGVELGGEAVVDAGVGDVEVEPVGYDDRAALDRGGDTVGQLVGAQRSTTAR